MTDNIVFMRGQPIVDDFRELLAKAEAGEIIGYAITFVDKDDKATRWFCNPFGARVGNALSFGVSMLFHGLCAQAYERQEDDA